MSNTITTPQTIEQWLQALAQCLTTSTRSDGTQYVHLSDGEHWQPIRDRLQDACRAAHRGELPNDWRFQAISDLTQRLLEYSEPDCEAWDVDSFLDVSYQIANDLADWSTSDLAQWIADHPARAEFEEYFDANNGDIARLLQIRQAEELQLMAAELLHTFSEYVGG
jgi:hypothetical protein